jgi:hypothetical protein
VDAMLVDIVGVDATGLIRYRLHDLLRDFARECLADTEPQAVREESLARLADEYIGAAKLAATLARPTVHWVERAICYNLHSGVLLSFRAALPFDTVA